MKILKIAMTIISLDWPLRQLDSRRFNGNPLGVNTECIPTLLQQGRPSQLCIYSVKKHLGAIVEDVYPGYPTKTTQLSLIRDQDKPGLSAGWPKRTLHETKPWFVKIESNLVIRKD